MTAAEATGVTFGAGEVGRVVDLGTVTVTSDMITNYARAVGDDEWLAVPGRTEAPPTFCVALRPGMAPDVPLPPTHFGVHGGHDLDLMVPIRAGETYRVTARIVDVFEKSGRSGALIVVVREVTIRDALDHPVARMVERQMIRELPILQPARVTGRRD